MNHRDLATLTRAFAPILREFVDGAVGPLVKRLDALEAGRGEDGEALAAVRREVDELGPRLQGSIVAALPKMPTVEEIAALVPAGKDGAPGRDGVDGRDGEPGAAGKDGVDGKEGAPGEKGDAGERGERGEKGDTGDRGEKGERGENGADGKDGAPGSDGIDGKDGLSGRDGADGTPGRDGSNGKDGIGLADAMIDRSGWLAITLTNGTVVKLGEVVGKDGAPGKDGADGLGFDDLEVVDDGMTFVLRFARGDQVKEFRLAKPTLADMHKGVWKEGRYERGSVVTRDGSPWLAMADTETKPGADGSDWLLVAKRGRDGKDGELKAPREPATVKLK